MLDTDTDIFVVPILLWKTTSDYFFIFYKKSHALTSRRKFASMLMVLILQFFLRWIFQQFHGSRLQWLCG